MMYVLASGPREAPIYWTGAFVEMPREGGAVTRIPCWTLSKSSGLKFQHAGNAEQAFLRSGILAPPNTRVETL